MPTADLSLKLDPVLGDRAGLLSLVPADGQRRRHRATDITTRCPGSRVRIDPEM
ncbi:hypothetical protein [Streptomyces antibioticus]|uniref:hypothetical protein n=1 Tax=Streptomyces antibioticus TaxID=1890 RepID=UPI0033A8C6E8